MIGAPDDGQVAVQIPALEIGVLPRRSFITKIITSVAEPDEVWRTDVTPLGNLLHGFDRRRVVQLLSTRHCKVNHGYFRRFKLCNQRRDQFSTL